MKMRDLENFQFHVHCSLIVSAPESCKDFSHLKYFKCLCHLNQIILSLLLQRALFLSAIYLLRNANLIPCVSLKQCGSNVSESISSDRWKRPFGWRKYCIHRVYVISYLLWTHGPYFTLMTHYVINVIVFIKSSLLRANLGCIYVIV